MTGAYALLDSAHPVHEWISQFEVPVVSALPPDANDEGPTVAIERIYAALADMRRDEGYIIQFVDGNMVKLKCPWYVRLHRVVSLLRERDVASAALSGDLDDIKAGLREVGVPLGPVELVEARVKEKIVGIHAGIEAMCKEATDLGLDKKAFALKYKGNPLFGLAINAYIGKEPDAIDWYRRHFLKEDFGLTSLPSTSAAATGLH